MSSEFTHDKLEKINNRINKRKTELEKEIETRKQEIKKNECNNPIKTAFNYTRKIYHRMIGKRNIRYENEYVNRYHYCKEHKERLALAKQNLKDLGTQMEGFIEGMTDSTNN
jgi:hypothetical protein